MREGLPSSVYVNLLFFPFSFSLILFFLFAALFSQVTAFIWDWIHMFIACYIRLPYEWIDGNWRLAYGSWIFFSFLFFPMSLLFWFVVFFGGCKHHTLYVQRIDTFYECLLSLLFCCMLYNFDVFQVILLWVHCIVYTDVRFAEGLIIGKSTICSFQNCVRIQSIICAFMSKIKQHGSDWLDAIPLE